MSTAATRRELPGNTERLLNSEDIAEICRVRPQTVRVWRMKGLLPVAARTPGGRPLHRYEDAVRRIKEEILYGDC